jgi:pimeloyl-ACP methyl ester carboxylesterase
MHYHCYTLNNGQRLRYTAWGNPQAQPVVCVHGLTRNARDFDFLARHLATPSLTAGAHAGFYVLCIDVLGRGKSSWASDIKQYAITNYAQQILELLTGLAIVKPHWVGTSMGGLIALALQLISPDFLGKVVFNDIGPSIQRQGLERIAKYMGGVLEFDSRLDAQAYAKLMFVGFGAKTTEEWAGLCDHYFVDIAGHSPKVRLHYDPLIVTATQQYVTALTDELVSHTEALLWQSLKSFQSPIHVLRGEMSDLLTANTVEMMQLAHPQLTATTIAACAHAPHLMNAAQVTVIQKFLQSASNTAQ